MLGQEHTARTIHARGAAAKPVILHQHVIGKRHVDEILGFAWKRGRAWDRGKVVIRNDDVLLVGRCRIELVNTDMIAAAHPSSLAGRIQRVVAVDGDIEAAWHAIDVDAGFIVDKYIALNVEIMPAVSNVNP